VPPIASTAKLKPIAAGLVELTKENPPRLAPTATSLAPESEK
jgi:hypothetical protein